MQPKHFSYLLILAMFFWCAGWPALKVLTYSLPLEVVSFWRSFLMIFAFIPVLFFLKKPLLLKREALKYVIPSAVLNVLFMVFAFIGVQKGFAGSGGVIITTLAPVLTFMLVSLIFKKHPPKMQIVGLVIGFIGGLVMLQVTELVGDLNGAEFYFFLCAVVWAVLTLISQQSHAVMHPVHYSFFIAIFAAFILFFIALPYKIMAVADEGLAFWSALLYLALFGQTIATTIYFIASGKLGSSQASSYMFLVPLFALVTSYFLLGESVELHVVIGGAVTLFGVYLINRSQRGKL
ncbi:MAG: DMT family transporter [Helicobacteraceae bacterium]|jgi:drug/metabolite transporter (DMT)-like permease|nr:DMT family transporter [Helicobacteraceae bacterium]